MSPVTSKSPVQLIGRSPDIIALRQEIERVARSDAKVLITGESGVGKEIVARAIHAHSPRASNVFAPVNCAGLPETLLESELFGHVKGSFTGAYRDKPGKLESAHNGTVFLDEIGEMTLRMQGLLLRFLETGELQKVGADGGGRVVNVRVIAATNRNLRDMIAQGHVPRGSVLPAQRHPPRACRRCASGARTSRLLVEHFLARFAEANRFADRRAWLAGRDEGAHRVLVAGQRARARERHRAAGRDGAAAAWCTSSDLPSEVRGAGSRRAAAEARASADGRRRPLQAAASNSKSRSGPRCTRSSWTARSRARNVRDVVRRGLEEARGNYKIVARLFNMEPRDYKRFLNFLRKHDCQIPFKEYR